MVIKKLLNRKYLVVFFGSFLLFFVYSLIVNTREYLFDSAYYHYLSQCFDIGSELNFPRTFRGCLFPLLLYLFMQTTNKLLNNEFIGFMTLASLTAALVTTFIPLLFKPFIKREIGYAARFLPAVLILIFWRGLILFPLTDLFSFAALFFSLCIISKLLFSERRKLLFVIAPAVVAGALLYFSYNTRTIYLFATTFVLLFCVFLSLKNSIKFFVVFMTSILIGFFALGSVQGVVNAKHGEFSFGVDIESKGLIDFQLTSGMVMSQYETYCGKDAAVYPEPGIVFTDDVGRQILIKEGYAADAIMTKDQYIELAFKYPLDFAGIFVRHFINILNPVFGEIYITSFSNKLFRSVLNYLMLFIVTSQLVLLKKQKRTKQKLKNRLAGMNIEKVASGGFLATILLPCLFILPGAVEVRFFFPMYILLYGVFAFCTDFKSLWLRYRERPVLAVASFVCIYLILSAMWGSNYANNAADYFISVI